MSDLLLRPQGSAPIQATKGRLIWRAEGRERQRLDIALRDMMLDETALFGSKADLAEGAFVLTGPSPLSGRPDDIKRWRKADGKLDVERMTVRWGGLSLEAEGALGLDPAFRLAGGLNLALKDGDAAVDALEEKGALSADAATAAKAFLAFAALAGGGRATVPLILADGQASLMGAPVGRLLPICACR